MGCYGRKSEFADVVATTSSNKYKSLVKDGLSTGPYGRHEAGLEERLGGQLQVEQRVAA